MPSRKKDIIKTLIFVENNEGISFSSTDNVAVDLDLLRKLMSVELISYDVNVDNNSGATRYKDLQIRIPGIIFLSNLEKEASKESFWGVALPQLEKLLWLVIGAVIVFISQSLN